MIMVIFEKRVDFIIVKELCPGFLLHILILCILSLWVDGGFSQVRPVYLGFAFFFFN